MTSSNYNEDNLPPAVPVNFQAFFAEDGTIGIEWNNNVEYDIKGYNVYRSINDTSHFYYLNFIANNYYYDDTLSYDTTYYYYVTALDNSNRESSRSIIISAKPANYNAPRTPVNLIVNARNWIDSVSIYLKWNPNPESDIAGYQVFRSESPGFTPDNSNLIGFSKFPYYTDKTNLGLYINYYYKIKAVDKGGLLSNSSNENYDMILEILQPYYPLDNSNVYYFGNFIIKALKVEATYKIVLQDNIYFGEIWSKEIHSTGTDDTLYIPFDISSIDYNIPYYWRIITYSNGSEPNSISQLYSFSIKQ